MKEVKNYTTIILAATIFQMLLTSCSNYYKAVSSPFKNDTDKAVRIDSLRSAKRNLILRNGEKAFYMDNAVLSADKTTVGCTLDTLSSFNRLYLTKGRGAKMRYKKYDPADLSVLNEAHIYIAPDTTAILGKYSLAVSKVQKVEVIEKDKQRTSNSHMLGWLAISAGIIIVVVFVVAAMLSSITLTTGF